MYKIEKHKFIQKFLISLCFAGLLFLTSLGYFGGWEFTLTGFIIYIGILFVQILILLFLYLILRMVNKCYYLISEKSIICIKKENTILTISCNEIGNIYYVRAFWSLLFQIGAGYLHIHYQNNNKSEFHSISMSKKDVRNVEKILNKTIKIK